MLPKDPHILFSVINTRLRDFYSSLDELCDREDEDKESICTILSSAGYTYNEKKNRFE